MIKSSPSSPSYRAVAIAALFIALSSSAVQAQSPFNFMDKLKAKVEKDLKDKVPLPSGVSENLPAASKSGGSDVLGISMAPAYKAYTGPIPPPSTQTGSDTKVGQILFSKKAIVFGKENKAQITNQFEAGDEIHAMAYTLGTLRELKFDDTVKFYIRDIEQSGFSHIYEIKDSSFFLNKQKDGSDPGVDRYFEFDVAAPKDEDFRSYIPYAFLIDFKKWLDENSNDEKKIYRTHVLELVLSAQHEPVAAGIIHLTITRESVPKVMAMYNTHYKKALEDFKLPASMRNDPALAAKIKAVMVARGSKVRNVIFSARDWGMIRHEISGAVLRRSIPAYIVSEKDGKLCNFIEIMFTSEYVGGSFSSNVDFGFPSFNDGVMLCSNAK